MTRDLWPALLGDYTTWLRSRGLTPDTIRTRLSYLRRFAVTNEPASTTQELIEWLARPGWSIATRKSAQSSLRSFYRWMVKAGHLLVSPAAELDPIKVPKRMPRPAGEDQVNKGLAAPDSDVALMVRLAATAGLRRTEIARLRREDVTPWGIHVHGKGGRQRLVPIPPDFRRELEARPPGWIFPGRFTGHIHPATVQKKVREAAGVAPHAHRHRFATVAYRGTRNLRAVQELLGHESPETTQVYVAVAGDELMAAVLAAAA